MRVTLRAIIIGLMFLFIGCYPSTKDTDAQRSPSVGSDTVNSTVGVHAAFYNNEGNRISVAATNGELILTDTALNLLNTVYAHHGGTTSGFFSLDDDKIVTGGPDSLVKVWNALTLEEMESYRVSFAPYTTVYGYNTIASCGSDGNVWIYWKDAKTNRNFTLDELGSYFLYYVIPDTQLVISSGKRAVLTGMESREGEIKFENQNGLCFCVMPDHSESRFVTASSDSIVRIYSAQGILLHQTEVLDGSCFVACFNPTGDVVAASTTAGSIFFMNSTLTEVLMKIDAFDTRINTIHYSPDGSRMVAGSEGGGAKIFDTKTGQLLYSLKY